MRSIGRTTADLQERPDLQERHDAIHFKFIRSLKFALYPRYPTLLLYSYKLMYSNLPNNHVRPFNRVGGRFLRN